MKDYQQRVVEEKKELDVKIEKLYAFLCGDYIQSEETEMMKIQHFIMRQYSSILEERIKSFT